MMRKLTDNRISMVIRSLYRQKLTKPKLNELLVLFSVLLINRGRYHKHLYMLMAG